MGRDSVGRIVNGFWLNGPEIEYRGGTVLFTHVLACFGVHRASYTVDNRSFPRAKWPECGFDQTIPSSAEVKDRVGLYLDTKLYLHDRL